MSSTGESRGMASHEINTHTYTSTHATAQQDLLCSFRTRFGAVPMLPNSLPVWGGGRGLVV